MKLLLTGLIFGWFLIFGSVFGVGAQEKYLDNIKSKNIEENIPFTDVISCPRIPTPDVVGLTLEEAEKSFGVQARGVCAFTFVRNSITGNPNCGLTQPDCTRACPKLKILSQSPLPNSNVNQVVPIKVNLRFDHNDVEIEESPFCGAILSGCRDIPPEHEGKRCLCSTIRDGEGWVNCFRGHCTCKPFIR